MRWSTAVLGMILLLGTALVSACKSPGSEPAPLPTQAMTFTAVPTWQPAPTSAIVISTKVSTPEPEPTATEEVISILQNLGVISHETVGSVVELAAYPYADIAELEFSPDDQVLRMRVQRSLENHTDYFLDLITGEEVFRLDGSQRVYFKPANSALISLEGGSLLEYNLQTKKRTVVYNDAFDLVALSPDGSLAVAIEEMDRDAPGTTFKVLDLTRGQQLHRIFVNTVIRREDLHFAPKGDLIAGTYFVPPNSYVTTFWSVKTGKAVHTLYGYSEIDFNPFLRQVAASNASQNYISLLNMDDWSQIRYLGPALEGPSFYQVEYTSYAGMIYALYDGIATYPLFWRPDTGERVYWMRNVDLLDLTISESSRLMATSDKRGYVIIWGIPK